MSNLGPHGAPAAENGRSSENARAMKYGADSLFDIVRDRLRLVHNPDFDPAERRKLLNRLYCFIDPVHGERGVGTLEGLLYDLPGAYEPGWSTVGILQDQGVQGKSAVSHLKDFVIKAVPDSARARERLATEERILVALARERNSAIAVKRFGSGNEDAEAYFPNEAYLLVPDEKVQSGRNIYLLTTYFPDTVNAGIALRSFGRIARISDDEQLQNLMTRYRSRIPELLIDAAFAVQTAISSLRGIHFTHDVDTPDFYTGRFSDYLEFLRTLDIVIDSSDEHALAGYFADQCSAPLLGAPSNLKATYTGCHKQNWLINVGSQFTARALRDPSADQIPRPEDISLTVVGRIDTEYNCFRHVFSEAAYLSASLWATPQEFEKHFYRFCAHLAARANPCFYDQHANVRKRPVTTHFEPALKKEYGLTVQELRKQFYLAAAERLLHVLIKGRGEYIHTIDRTIQAENLVDAVTYLSNTGDSRSPDSSDDEIQRAVSLNNDRLILVREIAGYVRLLDHSVKKAGLRGKIPKAITSLTEQAASRLSRYPAPYIPRSN